MADYNIAGPLNAMLRPVQLLDKVSKYGKRSVLLSANPGILHGFSLNKKVSFSSMLRTPLAYEISKDTRSAEIQIPQLIPGINFHAPPYPSLHCDEIPPDSNFSMIFDTKYEILD